ncbi:MAG: hypothetical protein LBV00_03765 [Propionibacteriaceae bacterium]|nr:hypothetical protein [Propionibacteriaceae bacterium]
MAHVTVKSGRKLFDRPGVIAGLIVGIVLVVVLVVIIGSHIVGGRQALSGESLVEQAAGEGILDRSVSQDEFDFFATMARRENIDASDAELVTKTKDMITDTNARFAIGSGLGVCEPFTYESFLKDLEAENALRASQKEKGEAIYGPERFEVTGYYSYVTSNLDLDIAQAFVDSSDRLNAFEREHGDEVKAYFEENIQSYEQIDGVTYDLVVNGRAPERIDVDWGTLRVLYATDDPLGSFLIDGQEGDSLDFEDDEGVKRATIVTVAKSVPGYEENRPSITKNYISIVYYPGLVAAAVAQSSLHFPQ